MSEGKSFFDELKKVVRGICIPVNAPRDRLAFYADVDPADAESLKDGLSCVINIGRMPLRLQREIYTSYRVPEDGAQKILFEVLMPEEAYGFVVLSTELAPSLEAKVDRLENMISKAPAVQIPMALPRRQRDTIHEGKWHNSIGPAKFSKITNLMKLIHAAARFGGVELGSDALVVIHSATDDRYDLLVRKGILEAIEQKESRARSDVDFGHGL